MFSHSLIMSEIQSVGGRSYAARVCSILKISHRRNNLLISIQISHI